MLYYHICTRLPTHRPPASQMTGLADPFNIQQPSIPLIESNPCVTIFRRSGNMKSYSVRMAMNLQIIQAAVAA